MQTTMTTKQAFRQLIRCHAIITVNTWNGINYLVTRQSWITLGVVLATCVTVSAACIMSARAERDMAQKKQAELQEQVEQLSCMVNQEDKQ